MFLLYSLILSLNISTVLCDRTCDCQEIEQLKETVQTEVLERNVLMEIVQKEMLERKMESSRLRAKIRRLEATQKSKPTQAKVPETGLTDRLEEIEAQFADINVKVDRNKNVAGIVMRGLTSEKQKRIEFISDMEGKLVDMKGTVVTFKVETTDSIKQCMSNITTIQDKLRGMHAKLHEMEGQNYFKSVMSDSKDFEQDTPEASTTVSNLSNRFMTLKSNGAWSQWDTWSSCSVSCGGGIRERERTCTNPAPSRLGKQCDGDRKMTSSCGNNRCPTDGGWSQWETWGSCSVSCGGGIRERKRTCTDPPPSNRGKKCGGDRIMTRICGNNRCSIDGGWSQWDTWSSCSVSCGGGIRERKRTCTNPAPSRFGKQCDGDRKMTSSCGNKSCPIDGDWSQWGTWSSCSVSCGGGTRDRKRTCTDPPPSSLGKQCNGDKMMTSSCGNNRCPIDGGWSQWGTWGSCNVSCGGGIRERKRTCTNPPRSWLGKYCDGDRKMTSSCGNKRCPIDGGWSQWDTWSSCSVSCGGGTRDRKRTCTDPPPSSLGKQCNGDKMMTSSCGNNRCPTDGGWSQWGTWGSCSVSCGGGIRERKRTCTNPAPSRLGKQCDGDRKMTSSCGNKRCPIDGGWSQWDTWSSCSVSCGGGTRDRKRTCTNPSPSSHGKQCIGDKMMTSSCGNNRCPIDGGWSQWDTWSSCSVSCGGGTRDRKRTCTDPPPSRLGKQCDGDRKITSSCGNKSCPIDGNWSQWGTWSSCSVSCGAGIRERKRTCTDPAPSMLGKQCDGDSTLTRTCAYNRCPVKRKRCMSGRACRHCPSGLTVNGVEYCCPGRCNVYGPLKMTSSGVICSCP